MTSVTGPTRAAPGARDAVFAQLSDAGRAEQVARRLADAIVLGVLAPGERLPSEAELSRRFGVALVTARDALGMLRDAGLVETRRGREGGSFVVEGADATGDRDDAFLESRLRGLAQVELADLAVYVGTIAEGCADRAAERSTPLDDARLSSWLDAASFDSAGEARRNASGFFLELAVLSQSTRLVREQIRLQAEFGPLLWLGMRDSSLREHTAGSARFIADAVSRGDGAAARGEVADLVRLITEWLLGAKLRVQRGGTLDA